MLNKFQEVPVQGVTSNSESNKRLSHLILNKEDIPTETRPEEQTAKRTPLDNLTDFFYKGSFIKSSFKIYGRVALASLLLYSADFQDTNTAILVSIPYLILEGTGLGIYLYKSHGGLNEN